MPQAETSPFSRLDAVASAAPGRLYARFGEQDITCGELSAWADRIARAFVGAGLRPGAHVAVMMANRPLSLALIFGIARARLVWVPVNTRQQGSSLRYILEHCSPALVIVDEALIPAIAEARAELPGTRILALGPDGDRLDLPGDPDAAELPRPPVPSDTFAVMYTSGTTGQPKGVCVTHRMFDFAARAVSMAADIGDGAVLFVWEPLFHIGGSQLLLLPLVYDLHLHMVPGFSASRFWDQVRESAATHIHYLGGILQILLRQPASSRDRDHRVRVAWGGGCMRDDWEAFERRFGVDIRECYGMTEASSMTTVNVGGPVGSVGRPVPWLHVELLGSDGRSVPAGERGEIVVSEYEQGALFEGYLDDPVATAKALRGGRLFTGDAGSFDTAGNLIFHGRLNDSVRHRGENISAWEIEHVAVLHPAVAEAAMIGVKADIGEQDIKLFVVLRPGQRVAAADLCAWLSERLGRFRTPRYIAFVDGFPKTPSERIRKGLLPRDVADSWDRENPVERALVQSA